MGGGASRSCLSVPLPSDYLSPLISTEAGHLRGPRSPRSLPLHGGLIVQLVLVQTLLRALGQRLPDALQDALPLVQRQPHVFLREEHSTLHPTPTHSPGPRPGWRQWWALWGIAPARGVGGSRRGRRAQHQPRWSVPTPVLAARSLGEAGRCRGHSSRREQAELGLRVTQGQQGKAGE